MLCSGIWPVSSDSMCPGMRMYSGLAKPRHLRDRCHIPGSEHAATNSQSAWPSYFTLPLFHPPHATNRLTGLWCDSYLSLMYITQRPPDMSQMMGICFRARILWRCSKHFTCKYSKHPTVFLDFLNSDTSEIVFLSSIRKIPQLLSESRLINYVPIQVWFHGPK